jgi:hypothetical protein
VPICTTAHRSINALPPQARRCAVIMLLRVGLRPRQGCKSSMATVLAGRMPWPCVAKAHGASRLHLVSSTRCDSCLGWLPVVVPSREDDTQRRLVLLLLAWPHLHASSDPLFCEHLMLSASPVPATRLQLTQLRNNLQRYLSAHALLISSQ